MKNDEKDLLDILFEGRNKSYGAYSLRRSYPAAMRNALLLTIGGLVGAFAVPYLLAAANRPETRLAINREIIIHPPPIIDPPPIKLPPPVEMPSPPVSAPVVKFVPPLVLPNELVNKEPELLDLDKPPVGSVGKKAVAGDPSAPDFVEEPTDFGERKKVDAVKAAPPEEPLSFVEIMPQFPGGDAAFLKYVAEHFQFPALARESGIFGAVNLSFIVEKSGEITNIQIVKDPGGGLGREAVRVVKTMPRWRAGNQNGNAVRVRVNLPIRVELK